MQVQIFNRDTNPNNLMGEGVVDLTKVLREKEHDGYFPLRFRGRQGCGDIYLELTFYGAVSGSINNNVSKSTQDFLSNTLLLDLSNK